MQVKIKFKAQGSSSVLGNFAPGDVARVHPDLARHLVEEAHCAVYDESPQGGSSPTNTAQGATSQSPQGLVSKVMQRINRRKAQTPSN